MEIFFENLCRQCNIELLEEHLVSDHVNMCKGSAETPPSGGLPEATRSAGGVSLKDPKGKTIMALRASQEQVGRPYVCPPGTPDNVMKILREAFAEVVNDPELKEDAKRINQRFEYLSAKECLNVANFVMNQPDAMVEEFEKYVKY